MIAFEDYELLLHDHNAAIYADPADAEATQEQFLATAERLLGADHSTPIVQAHERARAATPESDEFREAKAALTGAMFRCVESDAEREARASA